MSHLYIFAALTLAVISQLTIKWRMTLLGSLPESHSRKILFLLKALFDPFVAFSVFLTLIAGLLWMAAMTKFEMSYAYPFISLTFIVILVMSSIFFNEAITIYKILGLVLIIAGIIISCKQV